jgi:hypothetical protein
LLVKRLEQRVRFVDQLLNAMSRRILAPFRRSDPQGDIRDRRAQRGDANSEPNPKKRAREATLFVVLEAVGLGPWVGRMHGAMLLDLGRYFRLGAVVPVKMTSSTYCCVERFA